MPADGGRVTLDDGREMEVEPLAEGFLLHAPRRATAPAATAARCRCGSPAMPRRGPRWTAGRCRSRCARPSCSPRWPCTPTACTAEQLAAALYGDDGNPTTVRGEVLRLRGVIGAEVLRTRPYRLDAVVDTDFGATRRACARARSPKRCARARGRCCPARTPRRSASCATSWPRACARAVLDSDDVELLAEFAAHPLGGEDLETHDRLVEELPPNDPRRPGFAARLTRLLAE